jgi:hypothetical protein
VIALLKERSKPLAQALRLVTLKVISRAVIDHRSTAATVTRIAVSST